ncbi:MAG: YggS family pyridoxal phosphate-dependent enzyme [Candidatus Delongbacteria bacterium]|nr:YggS family pyridoxal phosphate-dependent enzyme [Candidatus Delongbacteria bacterium]MCG2759640.1 YggS family pyridoxal phosphate-dependent enzyme [Candidatus Delongbacteria bacterium]
MIRSNLENIYREIDKVCVKIGKDPKGILLVAVCKTFPVSANLDAIGFGQFIFGENKIQELVRKKSYLYLNGERNAKWHIIGHLQSNKAKQAVINADMFQCLDSIKLAHKLNEACIQLNRKFKVLIQINSSGEESKSGIKPDDLNGFLISLKQFEELEIMGLMSICAFNDNPEDSRAEFQFMKELFDKAKIFNGGNIDIKYLSIGMSSDYQIAIEEGANIIRLGTAIFGARLK